MWKVPPNICHYALQHGILLQIYGRDPDSFRLNQASFVIIHGHTLHIVYPDAAKMVTSHVPVLIQGVISSCLVVQL